MSNLIVITKWRPEIDLSKCNPPITISYIMHFSTRQSKCQTWLKHIDKPQSWNRPQLFFTCNIICSWFSKLDHSIEGNHTTLQTSLPDATPPTGKIHPSSKMAVTFEPMMQFRFPFRFRISISILWLEALYVTVKAPQLPKVSWGKGWESDWVNQWITTVFVEQPLALPGTLP